MKTGHQEAIDSRSNSTAGPGSAIRLHRGQNMAQDSHKTLFQITKDAAN
ncbi:hypothetical protein Q31a_48250 [Aureliella helgolandensis]|uniref:Uncharacterized protein n=1 Tax=Aureliella helgolandensis TaxID=2527968 RepID=A0A518GCX5_9BACT|nr:hypothetical protein Q31a_48250 [Aureliella helgolandensis]